MIDANTEDAIRQHKHKMEWLEEEQIKARDQKARITLPERIENVVMQDLNRFQSDNKCSQDLSQWPDELSIWAKYIVENIILDSDLFEDWFLKMSKISFEKIIYSSGKFMKLIVEILSELQKISNNIRNLSYSYLLFTIPT